MGIILYKDTSELQNHRCDTCNPIYNWMSVTPEMYDEYESNEYNSSILPRPLKPNTTSPYKRTNTKKFASTITSTHLSSSPTNINNTTPKVFK